MGEIRFYADFSFEYSVLETVSPLVRRIVARNPGPFTGPGTGTYVIGRERLAIVDPGPSMSSHIDAILHALRGETVEQIFITHTHSDHWPATSAIQQATGARSYAFDRGVADEVIRDGDVFQGPGWTIEAVHTPGHTSDHLAFAFPEENILFSGDHVMGWSTSVIIPPDGNLADYMNSLDRLLKRDDAIYLPTHGPAVTDPKKHVQAFIEHRNERTAGILARLAQGEATIDQIVDFVYVGLKPGLHGAAGLSVQAHLIQLEEMGKVVSAGYRYRLADGSNHRAYSRP